MLFLDYIELKIRMLLSLI